MKKSIKTIGIITTVGIILVCAYLLGTAQAKTVTEIQTMTGTGIREAIPDSYIDMDAAVFQDNYVDMRKVADFEVTNDGLQLYFEDGTGYWLER